MKLTEEVAKEKWCPEARIGRWNGQDKWGFSSNHKAKCQGSECMMWRWADNSGSTQQKGYCGKAGKPE